MEDNEVKYKFILYLDLDGVLTSNNYIEMIHKVFVNKKDKNFHYRNIFQQYMFQEEGINCLNALYNIIPYTIIISSTRRFEFTPSEWNFLFKLNGIKAYVGGRTDCYSKNKEHRFSWREDEIEKYHFIDGGMFSFKHLPFIIIDDDTFDLHKYEDKLVNVKTKTGLTMDYLDEILDKLKLQGVDIDEQKRKNIQEN